MLQGSMYPFFFTCLTSKIMYFQDLLIYIIEENIVEIHLSDW